MPRDWILIALSLLVGIGTMWYAPNHWDDLLAESMEQIYALRRRTLVIVLLAIMVEVVLVGIIIATR